MNEFDDDYESVAINTLRFMQNNKGKFFTARQIYKVVNTSLSKCIDIVKACPGVTVKISTRGKRIFFKYGIE